ncbi:hypothetical protein EJ04DRAFT_118225 [Polyplosphaeria fusca]|uniref:AMP-activated protein kinase glycogen-binding domain-containing protein n=1 Tax=Polyplosphaeria fusca TaxID=682080 RepID=A0A9P4R637_9PLEO|nr:hypothetical protein EJ04DRAFT_118225 [Polyplosphaeria fusca]
MGSYTFSWEHGGDGVVVTGDFDDWKKTIVLEKDDGIFKKTVDLPSGTHQYKFIVDGVWKHNDSAPKQEDGQGGYNNLLRPEDLKEPVSTLSSAAPESTTAALAGAVPKEEKAKSEDSLPGAFPETPFETPAGEPQAFSVNPIPATDGPGNPVKLEPGEKVPDPSTLTSNTIQSTVKDGEAPAEETVSVAPIPATAGAGNPIHLAPGEKVPDASTLTSNTIASTATTDAASYEKSDAQPPQLGPVVTPEVEREAKGGMFGLPPLTGTLIPESSLPKDVDTKTEKDPGVTVQSAAPASTTAALAGEVPKEPKGVPEAVVESQKEADYPPEASANPTAVEEKKDVEEELKAKVAVEPPAAEGATNGKVTETATAGATAAAGAFAAATYSAKEKAAETLGVNGQPTASSDVPEVVTESQKEAHVSPEASANTEAVEEKKEVEAELLKEVKKTDEAGEPAPTVTAATTETAPALSDDALADDKPLKSSSEPDALNAAASKPAQPAPVQPVDSRDISPMSKQPTTTEQTQPTVTTGAETTTTDAKTATETPKKSEAESSKVTPDSVASGATDKKKKRRSIFGKLKDKLSSK